MNLEGFPVNEPVRSDPGRHEPPQRHHDAERLPLDALDLSTEEVAERFRWARKRGHPFYVWPDVPVSEWRAALEAVEGVARSIVSGTPDSAPPSEPNAPSAVAERRPSAGMSVGLGSGWAGSSRPASLVLPQGVTPRALGIAAFTSGLGPLLGLLAERGGLDVPAPVARILLLHLEHGRRRAERLRRVLRDTVEILVDEGVLSVAIKGAHTALEYFPEPGTRPSSDIDLVIPASQVPAAVAALRRHGYRQRSEAREAGVYKGEWLPRGESGGLRSLELTHAGTPIAVDLHGSLDRSFFGVRTVSIGTLPGLVPPVAPEESRSVRGRVALRPLAVDGRSVPVLAQPHLLALLALQASQGLHNLTLVRLVEICFVIRSDRAAGRLRWDEFGSLLERCGAARFAYPALALVERLAPGIVEPGQLSALRATATPRMRRVLDHLTPAGAQRMVESSLDERFMWGRGPIDDVRRLIYFFWPRDVAPGPGDLARLYRERIARLLLRRVSLGRGSAAADPP